MSTRTRLEVGHVVVPRVLTSIKGTPVSVPTAGRWTHLQFRRFAGCPICNLHLQSILQRHGEIRTAGIREVVVFRSTRKALLPYSADFDFSVVADPRHELSAAFGVGWSMNAVLSPRALGSAVRGTFGRAPGLPSSVSQALALPADFLIRPDGLVVACKYGEHADDQWSVAELLSLAAAAVGAPQRGSSAPNSTRAG